MKLASFKDDNRYIVVVVNPAAEEASFVFRPEDACPVASQEAYATIAEFRRASSDIVLEKDRYQMTVPAASVVTFVGQVK